MPFQVEIHDDAIAQLDSFGLSAGVRARALSKLLEHLETLPTNRLPVCVPAPVVLRSHVIAIPEGDVLHHFVFRMMTNMEKRMVCQVDHRTSGPHSPYE
jgi:hypothetical protein